MTDKDIIERLNALKGRLIGETCRASSAIDYLEHDTPKGRGEILEAAKAEIQALRLEIINLKHSRIPFLEGQLDVFKNDAKQNTKGSKKLTIKEVNDLRKQCGGVPVCDDCDEVFSCTHNCGPARGVDYWTGRDMSKIYTGKEACTRIGGEGA